MGFGIEGDRILDLNGQPVSLVMVKELLAPINFPAMKGKPKLIIVQADAGGMLYVIQMLTSFLEHICNAATIYALSLRVCLLDLEMKFICSIRLICIYNFFPVQ